MDLNEVSKLPVPTECFEEPPFLVEHFPEKDTKVVRTKLDSLLKRIHKRHDFNGAILVAKNEKIVYNSQIGFADFKKETPLSRGRYISASFSKQTVYGVSNYVIEREESN